MKPASKLTKDDVISEIENWLKERKTYLKLDVHDCDSEEGFREAACFLLKKALKHLKKKNERL